MRRFLSFLGLFFSFVGGVYATHNRAGEITYENLGNFTYKVIVTTYTRASSVQADRDSLVIHWGDGDSAYVVRKNGLPLVNFVGPGELLGNDIKKNVYVGIHSYAGPSFYIISISDPNRIAGIINMTNSVSVPFFLADTLRIFDPGIFTPNNSPVLENPPIDYACVGFPFIHNPAAYDPDGDRMTFVLVPPMDAPGTGVPGYQSPDQFPPGGSTIAINFNTGELIWTSPQQAGIYNVAILIRDYRMLNGGDSVEMGAMIRDMQIIVKDDCQNHPPDISDVNDTCVIAGSPLDIHVVATDVDGNLDSLSAYGGPFVVSNPASFNYNLFNNGSPGFPGISDSASGHFTWLTDCSNVRKEFYTVVFKAADQQTIAGGDTIFPLTDLTTWNIRVMGPPPLNLVAAVTANSIDLSWQNPYLCASSPHFLGFTIWRKNACDPFIPDACDNDLGSHGYTEIAGPVLTYTYSDNTAVPGNSYSYRVQALFGQRSPNGQFITGEVAGMPSDQACVEMKKSVPVITNVTVLQTDLTNGVDSVVWSAPKTGPNGLDTLIQFPPPYKYDVFRLDSGNPNAVLVHSVTQPTFHQFVATASDSFFTDHSANLNTLSQKHSYLVQFYSGNNIDTVGKTQTASSVFLSITPGNNRLTLSWLYDVPWTNYKFVIWKKGPSASLFTVKDTVTSFSYRDNSVVNDSNYCYFIETIGQYSGTGLNKPLINLSEQVCGIPIDTVAPCPPALTITNNCSEGGENANFDQLANNLTWNNIPGCSEDIASYNIYYSPTNLSPLVLLATITNPAQHSYLHNLTNSLAGCYAIQAVDSSGNIGLLSDSVCVDNCPVYELPNVFTPNGDSHNDLFTPFLPFHFVDHVGMKIFNRWGELVYETSDPMINWDGTDMKTHKPLSEGVYYYGCDVYEVRVNGVVKGMLLKGYIHLIRGGIGTN